MKAILNSMSNEIEKEITINTLENLMDILIHSKSTQLIMTIVDYHGSTKDMRIELTDND